MNAGHEAHDIGGAFIEGGGALVLRRIGNTVLWIRFGARPRSGKSTVGRLATHAFSVRDMDRFIPQLATAVGYEVAPSKRPAPLAASVMRNAEGPDQVVIYVDTLVKSRTRKQEDRAGDRTWGAFGILRLTPEDAHTLLRGLADELGWHLE